MVINPAAFATGFVEHMKPVRIVVMEVLVYDMCGRTQVLLVVFENSTQ